MSAQHADVIIIGAGVSGIGMACQLRRLCPNKSFLVLERRQSIGGTWDLFRYPGIRSDSDMYTFGYGFRPWTSGKVLADGPSIKEYLGETAEEFQIQEHIRFGTAVESMIWSSFKQCWTITARDEVTGESLTFTTHFLIGCTGYYNYDHGYQPEFPGENDFGGQIIHPQQWPDNLDYHGQNVVIIGSGATAITLAPTMAEHAKKVTLLQRSPTYLMPLPSVDRPVLLLQRLLPEKWAFRLTRARNILIARTLFKASRRYPKLMKRFILRAVKKALNGAADMRHFTPDYDPWDQRLCVVKDGDLFEEIKAGRVEMATDHIERFTEKGIVLKSGQQIPADLIVPATGLDIQLLGGAEMVVDGKPVNLSDKVIYKNVMIEGVPNAGMLFGYTNLSWTLKVDIAAEYLCRLLNHMDKRGYMECRPVDTSGRRAEDTVMGGLDSGYIRRAKNRLPKQGVQDPWRVTQDYGQDLKSLRYGPLEDGYLLFSGKPGQYLYNCALS